MNESNDSNNYESNSNKKRNTRRETANPAELEDLLHNLNDSDSSFGNSNMTSNNNKKNDYFNFGSADQILKSTANNHQQLGNYLNDSSPMFSNNDSENRASLSNLDINSPVLSNASSSPMKLRRSSRVPSPSPQAVKVPSPNKQKSPSRRQSIATSDKDDDIKSMTSSSSFSDPISFIQTNKRRETVDSVDMEALRNEMLNDSASTGVGSGPSSVQSLHGKIRASLSTLATGSVFVYDMKLSPVQSVAASDRPIPTVFEINRPYFDASVPVPGVAMHNDSLQSEDSFLGDSKPGKKNSRRETADPSDLAAMLNFVEDDDTSASFDGMGTGKGRRASKDKKPRGRESFETAALLESVETLLGGDSTQDVNKNYTKLISTSISTLNAANLVGTKTYGRKRVSVGSEISSIGNKTADLGDSMLADIKSTYDADESVSIGNDTATITDSMLADELNLHDVNADYLNESTSSQRTVDVIASINALLAPHQKSAQLSPRGKPRPSVGTKSSSKKVSKAVSGQRSNSKPWEASLRHFSPTRPSAAKSNIKQKNPALDMSVSLDASRLGLASNLKSCMKSKTKLVDGKRSVIFGSPQVAEFNIQSPTTNLTPMTNHGGKLRFAIDGSTIPGDAHVDVPEDPETSENSRLLDQWDRLTNASDGEPDELSPMSNPYAQTDSPLDDLSSNSNNKPSSPKRSPNNKRRQSIGSTRASLNDSNNSDTVALPDNLGELLTDKQFRFSVASTRPPTFDESDDVTEKLESNLLSMIGKFDEPNQSRHSDASSKDHANTDRSLGALLGIPIAGLSQDISSDNDSEEPVSLQAMAGINIGSHQFNLGALTSSLSFDHSNHSPISEIAGDISVNSIRQSVGVFRPSLPFSAERSRHRGRDSVTSLEDNLMDLVRERRGSNVSGLNNSSLDYTQALEMDLNQLVQHINDDEGDSMAQPSMEVECTEHSIEFPLEEDGGNNEQEYHDDCGESIINESDETFQLPEFQDMVSDDNTERPLASESVFNSLNTSVAVPSSKGIVPATPSMNTQASAQKSALLSRLKSLNADARQNSLSQLATPLSIANPLVSAGMKRHSLSVMSSAVKNLNIDRRLSTTGTTQPTGTENAHPNFGYSTGKGTDYEKSMSKLQAAARPIRRPIHLLNFSLPSVFEFCTLTEGRETPGLGRSSLSTTAQTVALNAQLSVESRRQLESVFAEIFSAATTESQKSLDAMRNKDEITWSQVPDTTKEFLYQAVNTRVQPNETLVKALSTESILSGSEIWAKWEQRLASLAISSVDSMIQSQSTQMNEKIRQQMDLALQMKQEIATLESEIVLTRQNIVDLKKKYSDIKEQVSVMVEKQTTEVLTLVNENAIDHQQHQQQSNDIAESSIAIATAATKNTESTMRLAEIQRYVNVVNTVTYCKVVGYEDSNIVIHTVLSPFAKVVLTLALASVTVEDQEEYIVDHINTELLFESSANGSLSVDDTQIEDVSQREKMLSLAFFASVMCAEDIAGPLCERSLAKILRPAQIPQAMHKITGYVTALRRVFANLEKCFSVNGWSWSMLPKGFVKLRNTSMGHYLTLPLRTLVSGDFGPHSQISLFSRHGQQVSSYTYYL